MNPRLAGSRRASFRASAAACAALLATLGCGGAGGDGDAGPAGNAVDARAPDAAPKWPDPNDQPPWDDTFGGRLLGATRYGPNLVEFSLFAPNASTVSVEGDWGGQALERDGSGVWAGFVTIDDPVGKRYRFVIDGERRVADPYARAMPQHRGDSIIVATSYGWTDAGWVRPPRQNLVIYEMHVSDFTYDPSSGVTPANRGRYLGAIEKIPYLQRLGVNAVELMPVSESQSDDYGWGYNPAFLFAPEAGYASAIDGVQVRELQQLVDALHAAGIAVILDAVYNHVAGKDSDNPFWAVDSQYYFDFDGDGAVDTTPWGYKLATQRPMVRKLMFDNMRYWMDAYHVDGFRLDSTENIHFDAIADSVGALAAAGYGDRYFLLEEFDQGHNERVRQVDAAAGASLLSSWGTGYKYAIWNAVTSGNCNCASLGSPTFFSRDEGWQAADEIVNYYSSHDEGTLSARFGANQSQVRVAATHLLTALGIPMIWMGEEFQRLHYGNFSPNGDNTSRENNLVDWHLADQNAELVDFFAALIRLRIAHPALHSRLGVHLAWDVNSWSGAIGYRYTGTPGDNDFVVLVNYTDGDQTYHVDFPSTAAWYVMSDGVHATASAPGLDTWQVDAGQRAIAVSPKTGLVLMSSYVNP